jgi:hypothetical protein
MRIMYRGGFSRTEKEQWRVVIFSTLINAFQIVLDAMEWPSTELKEKENMVSILLV